MAILQHWQNQQKQLPFSHSLWLFCALGTLQETRPPLLGVCHFPAPQNGTTKLGGAPEAEPWPPEGQVFLPKWASGDRCLFGLIQSGTKHVVQMGGFLMVFVGFFTRCLESRRSQASECQGFQGMLFNAFLGCLIETLVYLQLKHPFVSPTVACG